MQNEPDETADTSDSSLPSKWPIYGNADIQEDVLSRSLTDVTKLVGKDHQASGSYHATTPRDVGKSRHWLKDKLQEQSTWDPMTVELVRNRLIYGEWTDQEESSMPVRLNRSGVGGTVPARGEAARPRCKKHGKFMKYNPAEDRMECKEDGCKQVARKKRTFRDAVGSEEGTSAPVYRGRLQFVVDGEENLYLYLPDANAMVSLEGLTEEGAAEPFENSYVANVKQATVLKKIGEILPAANKKAASLRHATRLEKDADDAIGRMNARQTTNKTFYGIHLPPHMQDDVSKATLLHLVAGTGGDVQRRARTAIKRLEEDRTNILRVGPGSCLAYDKDGNYVQVLRPEQDDVDYLYKRDRNYPSRAPHYIMVEGVPMKVDRTSRRLVQLFIRKE